MSQLLHGIRPGEPGWVDRLISFHRDTFGDARMEEGTGTTTPPPATATTPPAAVAPPAPPAPAPSTPPKPAPHAAPAAPDQPQPNVWDDPAAAKAEIERLRRENGAARTTAKAQAAEEARTELAQQIGKAIGLVKDEPVDPAKLVEQATQSATEARQANVALAVYKAAGAAGGDPAALLDSTSFQAKVKDLDPTDATAITAAITAAIQANPRLAAAPGSRVPAPNPAVGSSGGGAATDIDAQILAAEKARNFQLAIALKQQRAASLKS